MKDAMPEAMAMKFATRLPVSDSSAPASLTPPLGTFGSGMEIGTFVTCPPIIGPYVKLE